MYVCICVCVCEGVCRDNCEKTLYRAVYILTDSYLCIYFVPNAPGDRFFRNGCRSSMGRLFYSPQRVMSLTPPYPPPPRGVDFTKQIMRYYIMADYNYMFNL